MPATFHTISKYSYSYTLTNNDYAAKLRLWKKTTGTNVVQVADLYFMYDGQTIPAHDFRPDQQYARLYQPIKALPGIIDILRNEKPLTLTFNPPFAFLGTNLEPVGENESSFKFKSAVKKAVTTKAPAKKKNIKK